MAYLDDLTQLIYIFLSFWNVSLWILISAIVQFVKVTLKVVMLVV